MPFSMGEKNNEYKKNVVKLFEELKIKNKICPLPHNFGKSG